MVTRSVTSNWERPESRIKASTTSDRGCGLEPLNPILSTAQPGSGLTNAFASAGSQRCCASGPVSRVWRRTNRGRRATRQDYDENVKLTIDLDREEDGRWIADALELPGVMCYGRTRDEAISNTERLAIEVIADRIAHQELPSSALNVSFTIPDEQLARQ